MIGNDISIIITCYNNKKYIRECVLSVINQEYNNSEIIIVDDSSNDGSIDVIKELKEKYPEIITIFHTVNEGVEKTRNDGIMNSSRTWIMFLDGDDSLERTALKQLDLGKEDSDIIIADYIYYDRVNTFTCKSNIEEGVYSSSEIANMIGDCLYWEIISCIGNKVYNKRFLNENLLRFQKEYHFNEDGAFAIKALIMAGKIQVKNFVIYRYRCNWLGSMSAYRKNSFWTVDRVNDLLEEYVNEKKCGDIQRDYIKEKRRINLVHAINNEIRFGGKENFFNQLDIIQNNQILIEKLKYKVNELSNNWIYIISIIKDDRNNLINLGRQNAINQLNRQWLLKNVFGEKISQSMYSIDSVSIYGAGEVGKLLAEQLRNENIVVERFVDRKVTGTINGIICGQINEVSGEGTIINTVLTWNEDVAQYISNYSNKDIISIWSIMG